MSMDMYIDMYAFGSLSSALVLEEGASAYSSMGLTHDSYLGVLYERNNRISFARIPSASDGPLGVFC